MADFMTAIAVVLANEGGYSNDPNDPGGETNFGISKRSFPDVDIKNLTRDGAIAIYEKNFWRFGGVENQDVADKIFDLYVNHGNVRLVQAALAKLEAGPIVVDGQWGPQTEAAVNAADSVKLLAGIRLEWCVAICQRVVADNTQMTFCRGWLARAIQ